MKFTNSVVMLISCICFLVSTWAGAEEFTFKQERTFEVGKEGVVLKLNNTSGETIVESNLQDKVIIRTTKVVKAKNQATADQIAAKMRIDIEQVDSVLIVRTEYPDFKSRDFWRNLLNLDWGNSVWVDYHVLLPANSQTHISSSSGNVEVSGIDRGTNISATSGDVSLENTKGGADIKSTSGDIDLYGVQGEVNLRGTSSDIRVKRISGDMNVTTTSGDIFGEKLEGDLSVSQTSGDLRLFGIDGDIQAISSSGDMDIQQERGSLSLNTSSGDIRVKTNILPSKEYVVNSSSGDVKLYIASQSGAELKLKTASGDINCKIPMQLRVATSKKVEGTLNNGGAEIAITTASGNISLFGE